MINIKEYIESGIIEEYALGNISEQEKAEVECLSNTYPEIAAEIEATAISLSIFSELGATKPDERMRELIWEEIQGVSVTNTIPFTDIDKTSNTNSQRTSQLNYLVAATLSIIAFGAVVWGVSNNTQLAEAENQIAELNTANQNITRDFSELRGIVENNNSIYELPNTQVIKLSGIPEKSPNSMAYAIWDKTNGDVYLDLKNLPENPEGKQYQLWTISDAGVPISVGVFDQKNQLQVMNLGKAESSVMFAVTLEKQGGVESPTMSEMYIAGEVTS